jgi:HEAT repeat protein
VAAAAAAVRRNPVLDAALEQLDDPTPSVRTSAENAVRFLAPAPDPAWLEYNRAPDAAERIRRVRLLPFSSDANKKYDAMIAASRESDAAVRKAAFGAMRRSLESPKIVDRLIAALEKDDSVAMRILAAHALGSIRDTTPKARAALTAAANGIGVDPKVAAAAKAALGK